MTNPTPHEIDLAARRLLGDLPQVACDAAIAVDNFILRRPNRHSSALSLIDWLAEEQFRDPSSVVLVHRAIQAADWPERELRTVTELRGTAARIRDMLGDLSSVDAGDLPHLRTFCLELSKQASAHQRQFRRRLLTGARS